MSRRSRTEFAILGMLTQSPLAGYDLKKLFEQRIAHFWAESAGQIYPTLKRLADEGLITSKDRTRGNGPKRIEYRITSKGRKRLEGWLCEPIGKEQVRNELLLKVYFGPNVDVESMIAQIEAFEALQKAMKTRFKESEKEISNQMVTQLQKDYWKLTLLSGQLVNDARIKWCRKAKEVLSQHVNGEI